MRRRRMVAVGAILAGVAALVGILSLAGTNPSSRHRVAARHALSPRLPGSTRVSRSIGASPAATLPFAPNPLDRATRPDEVPSVYADQFACSTGCRPYGAQLGWPLKPFHEQHPLRAGLNELRPRSLHVGLDIQARDGAAVYAVQPGIAHVLQRYGPNGRIQVGNYIYWHINPTVSNGQYVAPHETMIGTVMAGYGHIAFSEVDASGKYVNPLRPGGSVLEPYVDRAPPQIASPAIAAGGQVIAAAYDPQSFVERTTYVTPVLAPAALAYRLFATDGTPITPLEWAFGGAHLLPWRDRSLIYTPGSGPPGYGCFATRSVCVPHWTYRVAGGFAPPLPPTVPPGSYRLTIYAWDWADNTTALDTVVTMTATGWRPIGHFPTVLFHVPGYYSQRQLLSAR